MNTRIQAPAVDAMEPACALALAASFGSVERWREEFVAMAKALGSGPGEVRLVFRPHEGRLVNESVVDPGNVPVDGVTILALATITAAIDWAAVYARYQAAVHAASEAFATSQDDVAQALLLDVRRAGVYEQAGSTLPGARWCDPAQVASWAGELPRDRAVLVYCVYGHEVGRATALRLRAAGLDARFLEGGIDAWKAAGRPLVDKPAG